MPHCQTAVFSLDGATWRISQPADLEELWAAMGPADFADERIPYWTEIWPASLGLAQWLARQPLAGKFCLDLGCGLGLAALAGVAAGARVLACDYEPAALLATRRNAALNDLPAPALVCMDWRRPCLAPGGLDIVWAADIIYERRSFQPVLDCLRSLTAPGGKIWLAEPGRAIFQPFASLARACGWRLEPIWSQPVRPPRPPARQVRVTIWQLALQDA